MPYGKKHPQRVADLAALMRYLFVGKNGEPDSNHVSRLADAPLAYRLIQRVSPFGATSKACAYDMAQQLFDHARNGPTSGALPFEVYKHIVIALPPGEINRTFKQSAQLQSKRLQQSRFSAVIRIVRECLDAMSISESLPHLVVVHNDRSHVHAHVVTAVYAQDMDCSKAFSRLTPDVRHNIAATIYAAHGWDFPYPALEEWYRATLELSAGRGPTLTPTM